MEIRKAKQGDVNSLIKLKNLLTNYHADLDSVFVRGNELADITEEHIKEYLEKENYYCFVAEDNNQLVGFIAGNIKEDVYKKPKQVGNIKNFYIKNGYRNQKIGEKLFSVAKGYFKSNNITYIEVVVNWHNKDSIEIYKQLGFKEHAVIMDIDMS